jgi:N-acetylmuramoyl-L-alanine amidase
MRPRVLSLASGGLALLLLGCAGSSRPALSPRSAPRAGPLVVTVVYPPLAPDSLGWRALLPIAARDSTFLFGSVGRGDATLTVNGGPVGVSAAGTWIAWVPLPDDTVAWFDLEAQAGAERATLRFAAALPPRFLPPAVGPWIDTTSFAPTGDRWILPGEGLTLTVRASPSATLRALLPDSTIVPFARVSAEPPLPWGERAFGTVAAPPRASFDDRHVAWRVGSWGPDPGPVLLPASPDTGQPGWVVLEAIDGPDTARVRWPLRVGILDPASPTVAIVNDDTAGVGTDSVLAGRPAPYGTYHWFFPTGTRAAVSGRWNGQVRLQLSDRSAAWVDAVDVQPLPAGTPPPRGATQAMRLYADAGSVTLRVPAPERVPFRVDEDDRRLALTLYGVAANADWIQYGPADSLVTLVTLEAPAYDETRIVVQLSRPVWGYRTRWAGNDLLLEIRRPPGIAPRRPLDGRVVALDPGHPPAGATGPSGARERDVTLAVGRRARDLFRAAGAQVVLVRGDTLPLGLAERIRAAEAAGAEILVSIHANALPDGVNPFANNGTSTYFFHPRSAPFARSVNAALVRRLGFRDLGVGRGDLALVRSTWMPSILTEGLFMMIPEQEAILTDAAGQEAYARGLVEGTAAYLAEWARRR